ncbi:NPCBM/NEW2 domain-containing protein [Draconibacterium sp. IB214405]|uniref:NPCBM/NEW2 domain-containing protein n=1 Tax=Draconibacterium sp. IB214405 TaxID=3097352 RepID=UPI002A185C74|nr:NPCBM/NEW2 domain-containing protein [Draconibacterium sp. IB214405]MDX8337547.1 NPCBM/NEW2 domain-containing protein [Draconibacterium sp. IB214405]
MKRESIINFAVIILFFVSVQACRGQNELDFTPVSKESTEELSEDQNSSEDSFHNWALTPPMGWNSWDCFGPSVVETEVKANADYMAANLKESGWEYIVVDIRWYVDNQTTGHYNAYNNSTFILDEYGRYMPSPTRFPSAANGAGFKPLADYVHSMGLKFGIHIMRGVPKEAVYNKLPIKGTTKTAADIYSTAYECTWLQDNYTVVANREGAQEYYNSIFDLYASWGVDFVKVDDLSRPYHTDEIEMIRKAIDQTGRPIVLSMSPGATPVEEHEHATSHANMWRTIDDFWDNWAQLNYSFEKCAEWAPYIQPGAWPDADMLPLGKFIRGERATNRYTKFTKDEQYTLMTLWTMFKSPLMFGGNLPDNDAFTNSLLTNDEVLNVHAHSTNNKQWFNENGVIGWTANDPESSDKYVALFNSGGDGFVNTNSLLYRSGTVSRLTDGYGEHIDIKLPEGSKELYLIVNDGGDDFACDHADWINPTVYLSNGDSIKLTDLTWKNAFAGWGNVSVNKSVSGGSLNIKGTVYENGIGTHSKSIIHYEIPENSVRFKAFAGLDIGGTSQQGGATVEFMVSVTDPTSMDEDAVAIPVNLKELGFSGDCAIRDLWEKKDLGTFSGVEFAPTINYHGAGLYRISPSAQ